jgi:hypothetical protein
MTEKVEAELVKSTKYKPKEGANRQEYLAGLLHNIDNKLSDAAYDKLSEEAVDWHRAAVKAFEDEKPIPEFEGADSGTTDTEPDHQNANDDSEDRTSDEETSDAEPAEVAAVVGSRKASKKPKSEPKTKVDYDAITGEKDRYGITIGTKTHLAVKLYEKGASLKQVEEEIGGRHYNILMRLTKEGHTVEKMGGGIWKITHKDDPKKAK